MPDFLREAFQRRATEILRQAEAEQRKPVTPAHDTLTIEEIFAKPETVTTPDEDSGRFDKEWPHQARSKSERWWKSWELGFKDIGLGSLFAIIGITADLFGKRLPKLEQLIKRYADEHVAYCRERERVKRERVAVGR